jgi:O-antigen ligase
LPENDANMMSRAARLLTFASAVTVLFSIAVSQILLALALVSLLLSGEKLRLPRIWLPLALFIAATLVSLAFSPDPYNGLPQVRKIFVFVILLAVFSVLRDLGWIRRLFLCWIAGGALVAVRGLVQFASKMEEARATGQNFYEFYVAERITGFMSHWMTFGGQQMFVLLALASFLFFAPKAGRRAVWLWLLCAAVLFLALLLGFTRSIWLATAGAGIYLLWHWRRWLVLAAPLVMLVAVVATPGVKTRFVSIFKAKKEVDSNQHRIVTWRTGLRMIEAHPLLGLGPEEVKARFDEFVPPDVPRPLPTGWYGHLHNIYLHYAAERGIPALLALLWMLGLILLDFVRKLRKLAPGPGEARFVLHTGVAVVIATLIAGFFELNLGDSEVLTMFLVVTGSGYVAVETAPELSEAESRVAAA